MTPGDRALSRRQALARVGLASAAAIASGEQSSIAKPVLLQGPAQDQDRGTRAKERTTLANLTEMTAGQPVILGEPGREGMFVFDGSDLSTKVSADTQQGIYIAPSSDPTGSSGAWVREFDGAIDPAWFGFAEANSGAQNDTAIQSMMACQKARAVNNGGNYQGLEPVEFTVGTFQFASTIEITDGTVIWRGASGGPAGGAGTWLEWPSGVTGIRVQRYNTSGATATDAEPHKGGDGSRFDGLTLVGGDTALDTEAHGFHLRARAFITNCVIANFDGDAIFGASTAGGATDEGNTNGTVLHNVRITGCRTGVFIDGGNSNAWHVSAVDIFGCRRWGIWDSSFLGNYFFGCQVDGCSLYAGAYPPSVVSHNGNRYYVIHGRESEASINAPSGTTTDNRWWSFLVAGGPDTSALNAPTWVSGTSYRSGGSYCTDNANARSGFFGCYHESGQGNGQFSSATMVIGGQLAQFMRGPSPLNINLNVLEAGQFSCVRTLDGVQHQTNLVPVSGEYLWFYHATDFPRRMKFVSSNSNLQLRYSSSANPITTWTGPKTTAQFGTGMAVPYAAYHHKLMVGDSLTNARLLSNATAAPSTGTHGQGQVHFNRTPSLGEPAAWICTVAGSPGEHIAIPGQALAPTSTYIAPSGGATVDTEARASLAQLAADLADLKIKLAASGATS